MMAHTFQLAVLGILLTIAVITDVTRRKVYNWLTLPAMVLGMALHAGSNGWAGLWFGLAGAMAGGLIFFPFVFIGAMGAGDIKLMAAIGAFIGWTGAVNMALYTSLAGGMMAVLLLLIKGDLIAVLKKIWGCFHSRAIPGLAPEPLNPKHAMPYAAAIAVGTACAVLFPPLLELHF